MIYVFDSSTLIDIFHHYYPEQFPSFWETFNTYVKKQKIISVREVRKEIEQRSDMLSDWAKQNADFFPTPEPHELDFVKIIFTITHFQNMIRKKERLQGKAVADPFVIAKAKLEKGVVVTEEVYKPHSAQIPNVCKHFGIGCVSLKQFMMQEKWVF